MTNRETPTGWANPDRHHPPAYKFRALSNGFYKLAQKFPEGQVDMRSTALPHVCKTPGCFAGWSAAVIAEKRTSIIFREAAELTAEFLGFENSSKLELWTHYNTYIWGNCRGSLLFNYTEAFMSDALFKWAQVDKTRETNRKTEGDPHAGYLTLTAIADWLAKVADRLSVLEQKERQEEQQKVTDKFISTLKQNLETVPDPVVPKSLPKRKNSPPMKVGRMIRVKPSRLLKDSLIKPNFKKSR